MGGSKLSAMRKALPVAFQTIIAMTATVLLIAAVDPTPGMLVLGAVLAMTLSRSKLIDTWRGRVESVIVLPVLAIVTSGVAALLAFEPLLGAIAFTAAMFFSVWLRRFGPTWQRIGSLVALPFITLLIAPAHLGANPALRAAVVSLVALVIVVAVRTGADAASRIAGRAAVGAAVPAAQPADQPPAARTPSTLKPIPSTRMAIQLGVAIAAAFVLGFWLFPGHWGWVVLTAYLVHAGNRGRADVLHKSGLRIAGAAAGSLAAVALGGVHLEGPALVAVVLGAVAVGLLLRDVSYAFWALVVTLALTVLQSGLGGQPVELWPRVLAILLGAACGVLTSWFILPIRSEGVLRLRIANVLAGLDAMASEGAARPSIAPIDEVAPPFIALARIPFAPARWRRAGEWVRMLRELDQRDIPPSALPVLRKTRKAMREPEQIGAALTELLTALKRED